MPLGPLPSTVRVVCVLDLSVLANADIRQLHVGSFGNYDARRHLKPLMEAAVPQPAPMQAAVRGSKVEMSADQPTSLAPLPMRATGKARGVHFWPWIVTGASCQHLAFVLRYKQPLKRRWPSAEV